MLQVPRALQEALQQVLVQVVHYYSYYPLVFVLSYYPLPLEAFLLHLPYHP